MPAAPLRQGRVPMRLSEPRFIRLPKIDDPRGSLTFLEAGSCVPFEIKRVFYLYELTAGAVRAGHALQTCEQLIVAAAGAFEVVAKDGVSTARWTLNSASNGLYVPAMTWLEIRDFLPGSVCLVLASERYSEDSYIRSWEEFSEAASRRR